MLAAGEQVIMQTVLMEAMDPDKSTSESTRIMMDTGGQTTYVTEEIAKKLQLRNEDTKRISVFTFGANKPGEDVSPRVSLMFKSNEGNSVNQSKRCASDHQ